MPVRLQSTDKAVLSRIYGHGRGWVFSPRDFLDLGPRAAVASALKRHKDAGRIRQLARGLYDYPKRHPTLGSLTPSIDAIARALAGRDATRLLPASGYAATLSRDGLLYVADRVNNRIQSFQTAKNCEIGIGYSASSSSAYTAAASASASAGEIFIR